MFKICLFYVFSTFALLTFQFGIVTGDLSKIDAELLSTLENGDTANVLIFFEKGVQPAIQRTAELRLNDRSQRNFALYDSLRDHADASQSGVTQLLSSTRSAGGFQYYKQYWTGNKIFIKEANAETVKSVAEDPQVLKIKREPVAFNPEPVVEEEDDELGARGVPDDPLYQEGLWGLNITQVPEAWEALGGNRGEGVIVANIDSGVRYTHEALKENFIGLDYGWLDARFNSTEPEDNNGHGTHTMGILSGSFGIGVAPSAKWMACRSSDEDGYHSGEALLDCMKWIACPTLQDGSNPDCSRAPHVVSNSWVARRGSEDFNEEILVWREMGILPIFAIGNSGPGCNKTRAPAELPFVIGVGFTNTNEKLTTSSCTGWASDGGVKPDIVAPGVSITSASYASDTFYIRHSGSSMATPLVAGVVALLKARDLDLTYDEAYNFLVQNTDNNFIFPESTQHLFCNESSLDISPNIYVGYGRVNALKAVRAQTDVLNGK